MLEYSKIINQPLKNKNYFSGLIHRHQNLKNKSQHKKEVFDKLGLVGFNTLLLIIFVLFLVFQNKILIISFYVGCPVCLLLTFVKNFIGEQEIKCMAEIESEFFSDLKNDHELIKDLSTLVIDDDTEEEFNCIIDNVVQESDDDTFYRFNKLLCSYDFVQSNKGVANGRNEFLQKLKIDVRQKSEEADAQESFQVKARGRVLEML